MADVSVLSCAHDVADARLHRTCAALRRAGLTVEVIGLGDPAGAPAGTHVVSLGCGRGKSARVRNALTLPFRARGRVLVTFDPDLVPAASLVRLLSRRRLVVDVHEDYLALLQDRAWARRSVMLGAAARVLVRLATWLASWAADLTVVADDHVPPPHARRRLVVRNLPDPAYLPKPGEPDEQPRAIYIGDVRRSRGLRAMIAAVEAAPGWHLDLVGPIHPDDAAWLDDWCAASPAATRVRRHGRLAPERAWALAEGAWAGLALLEDTPAFRAAMPTKLYEYLGSGLATLVTPLPRMAELASVSGAGRVVADATEAAAVLREWADRPELVHRLRAGAARWREEHVTGGTPSDELAREIRMLLGA